jgi:ABC-type antimicrobial peptide transport system permease subunit
VSLILAINIGFAILLYVAHTKLPQIEEHFNRCSWVNDTYKIWGNSGFVGKIHRVGIIYAILLLPTFWRKKDVIDFEKVQSLPKPLRMWIQIPYTLMIVAALLVILIYLLAPRN